MQEIWKDIPEYEGKYQVSNMGQVKSLNYDKTGKEKILKHNSITIHHKNRNYIFHQIMLYKNGKKNHFLVSRLVWTSFNDNIPNGYDVDHIDNNPENNRLDNLQLLTRSENLKKRFIDNPDFIGNIEKINPKKKIRCLNNGVIYESIREAARQLNLYTQNISNVLKGRRKTTGGYRFEYIK